MTDASASAVRDARLTWIIGGSLLIACAALQLVQGSGSPYLPNLWWVADALWASALLLFAFGLRRAGSVVARRPLGVVALIVAAVMPFVTAVVLAVVPAVPDDTSGTVLLGQSLAVMSLAALLVATVEIARSGAVPPRLRWVPFILLCVVAGVQIALQVALVSTPSLLTQTDLLVALFVGAGLVGTVGVLVLGILAIVSAPREAPRQDTASSVQVYPPA